MLFNSVDFAIFLPIVFVLYWVLKRRASQNVLLLVASYVFYAWWDWRFLFLIAISSITDYLVGLAMARSQVMLKRRLWLLLSIAVNIGFLGFFKYYDFFAESFANAFTMLGAEMDPKRLNLILPVGISFYTFQTLSYSIDIFKQKLKPTRDVVSFFAFVSFFPQLVAGPIERARNLLPQFQSKRSFSYAQAVNGLRQILWGVFKKVVIADSCAGLVDIIFSSHHDMQGITLLLGAFLFAFQIYGDFSGYSDIAIGTARLFGFNLMRNFAFPYFARDIAEFWRRWHISLSTWFRDYVYIPLGGSRGSSWTTIRNILVIFLVSGFWHGANWTFLAWGLLNAIYFLPLILFGRNRINLDIAGSRTLLPTLRDLLGISVTFLLTTLAWVFFRAANVGDALLYLKSIALTSFSRASVLEAHYFLHNREAYAILGLILFLVVVEWWGRKGQYGLDIVGQRLPKIVRWSMYYAILLLVLLFGGAAEPFIYFQF